MKEHPILFSSEMVKAILDGRKTQTRRVIKPQPRADQIMQPNWGEVMTRLSDRDIYNDDGLSYGAVTVNGKFHLYRCPYGAVGDHLWVRETWRSTYLYDKIKPSDIPINVPIQYKADMRTSGPSTLLKGGKWRPSIFMPRWASRITLEITGIRVEKIQIISEDDAYSEGISGGDSMGDPCGEFMRLWDSINEKRGYGWDKNPYIWVVNFERKQLK